MSANVIEVIRELKSKVKGADLPKLMKAIEPKQLAMAMQVIPNIDKNPKLAEEKAIELGRSIRDDQLPKIQAALPADVYAVLLKLREAAK